MLNGSKEKFCIVRVDCSKAYKSSGKINLIISAGMPKCIKLGEEVGNINQIWQGYANTALEKQFNDFFDGMTKTVFEIGGEISAELSGAKLGKNKEYSRSGGDAESKTDLNKTESGVVKPKTRRNNRVGGAELSEGTKKHRESGALPGKILYIKLNCRAESCDAKAKSKAKRNKTALPCIRIIIFADYICGGKTYRHFEKKYDFSVRRGGLLK